MDPIMQGKATILGIFCRPVTYNFKVKRTLSLLKEAYVFMFIIVIFKNIFNNLFLEGCSFKYY